MTTRLVGPVCVEDGCGRPVFMGERCARCFRLLGNWVPPVRDRPLDAFTFDVDEFLRRVLS